MDDPMLRLQKNFESRRALQLILGVGVVAVGQALLVPTLALTTGCEEYTVASAPPPPPPPKDPSDPDGDGFKRKSVLGKAYETAENRVENMNEYQRKVGEFADDLFDQKRGPSQKPMPKPAE